MKIKKLLILSLFFAFSNYINAAKIGEDTLSLGKPGSAADKIINLGPVRQILSNETSGKLQFTNDGSVFKDIGSGAGTGGAQNFFTTNPDAESALNNWTNTGGGTFVNGAFVINGDASFRWDASAQNDVLRTDQITIPERFKGQACQIEFSFTGGTSDLIKPQVVDSSNVKLPGVTFQNQVDGSDFLQAQTVIVTRSIFFLCPSSGTIAFEFLQTEVGNPAFIDFDDVHIGQLKGLVESVLPDVFTATFSGASVLIAENIAGAITVTDNGTGDYTYQLNFPHTISPACVVNDTSGNPKTECKAFLSDINTLEVSCEDHQTGPFNAVDRGNVIVCYKQGVDAKQTVQVFNSIPKVVENINEFSALVGSAAIVITENVDWIDGNCVASGTNNATFTCPFISSLNLTVAPSCTCSVDFTGENTRICKITDVSSSQVIVQTATTANVGDARNFHVQCIKQGVDFKLPTVQPIIIRQVETSIVQGMRIESCAIDATSGTPLFKTANNCGAWISSIGDNGVGDMTVNIAVAFSTNPTCVMTCGFSGGSECNAQMRTNIWNPSAFRIITSGNDGVTKFDAEITVICTGAR